jgi:hypothetical protein
MTILRALMLATAAMALTACASAEERPTQAALDVTCDTGGRHGPSGILDYRCVDGDGEERLRPRSLHEVIEGAPIEGSADDGR